LVCSGFCIYLEAQNKSNDALKQVIEALRRDKLQRQRILKRLVRPVLGEYWDEPGVLRSGDRCVGKQ
jgi:hypothetical protein